MAYNAQQQSVIDEATRRAQANGTTPEMEAWKYAQSTGMNPNQVDNFFGWNSGTTGKWAVDNGQAPAPQGHSTQNLGLGATQRADVISKATDIAKLQGITPERALYNYAKANNISNSQVDQYMGFNAGATDQWAQANLGLGSQPAQTGGQTQTNAANPTTLTQYTQNPYLPQMAAGITQQMNDNWTRNLAPSIRSGAMAAGGFGGSRQGVVEANGLRDLNTSLGQNITNLYGQDYNNQMNRNMQQYQTDSSANLGYANLDSNNAQFGANYGLNALNAQNTWANNNLLTANALQQTPIDYNRYFTGQVNQTAGQGQTNTATTTGQGSPITSGIGGMVTASSIYNNLYGAKK